MAMAMAVKRDRVVKSPRHFYHMTVEYLSDIIMKIYYGGIDVLEMKGEEIESIEPIYKNTIKMIDNFNNTLKYKSTLAGNKRIRPTDNTDETTNPKRPKK